MDLTLRNSTENIQVKDEVFGKEYNEALVHQVLASYQRRGHDGSRKQKSRAEVRGSGAKPWRQKGTGRARAGTRKSPIWQGGGVTFAARPEKRELKVNRKMYRGAMRCILSELIRQDRLSAVQELPAPDAKTKQLREQLDALEIDKVLLVDSEIDESLSKAAKNLHLVEVLDASRINPLSLIQSEHVLISVAAMRQCEEALA